MLTRSPIARRPPASLALALIVAGAAGACRLDPEAPFVPAETGSGGSASSASDDGFGGTTTTNGGGSTGGRSGSGGSGSTTEGASGGASSSGGVGGGNSSEDGAANDAGARSDDSEPSGGTAGTGGSATIYCDAEPVTFDELRSGAVRLGANIQVEAVATSQKFLVSHASSGSCLFGATVGIEPEGGEPRGLFVVSYGEDAPEGTSCAPGKDGIPDDLLPGDALVASGRYSTYAPSSCGGTAESPQLLVDATCPLQRHGATAEVSPVVITLDQADAIALGTDVALLRRYAAGLVRLENVNGLPNDEGTGVVGAYGVINLAETRLPVTNDIGYGDLSLGGPGDAEKSLAFAYPTRFTSLTGVIHLDYCAWSLAPRDRCTDLVPPSRGCPSP